MASFRKIFKIRFSSSDKNRTKNSPNKNSKTLSLLSSFLLLLSLSSYPETSLSCPFQNLHPSDVEALLQFRTEVYDPYDKLSDWRRNQTSEACCWGGVTCVTPSTGVSRVVNLTISVADLNGTLPASIGNLTALRILDLSNNFLYGPIPDSWGNLSSLETLILGGQFLNGTLEILSNFKNLSTLDLVANDFAGDLGELPFKRLNKLKTVLLYANSFSGGFPDWLKYLPELEMIDLSQCENLTPSTLPSDSDSWPAKLTVARFKDMHLVGEIPSVLASLSSLTELDLSRNFLSGSIPKEFGLFEDPDGVILDLSTNNLTGEIPLELAEGSWSLLSLYSNRLSGNVSDFLSRLCVRNSLSLSLLALQENQLHGEIPEGISKCVSLNFLQLSSNFLSGSLPANLSLLENLFSLCVEKNKISGQIPTEFAKFQKLNTLLIHTNQLSGPIPPFNSSSLSQFWAYSNNLTGDLPKSFRDCTNLEDLQLQNNQISGQVSILNNLPFLTNLNLTANNFSGNLPYIKNWTSLVQLDLSYNYFNGSIPQSLGINAQSLVDVDLSHNFLEKGIPSSLLSPPGLLSLDISYNSLTQFFDSYELNSTTLTSLQLQFNQISASLPVDTLSNLPSLMVLDLQNNKMFGPIPSNFSRTTRLKELQFSGNYFWGDVPEDLYFIKSLTHLNISNNRMNGSIPDLPTTLSFIDLSNNSLSGTLPSFNGFDFLQILDLSMNNISGSIPPNLALLSELEFLDLSQNSLSGTIPSTFSGAIFLKYFNVSSNSLKGPIPNNLSLFPISSFKDNANLCGAPLSTACESNNKGQDGPTTISIVVSCSIAVFGILLLCLPTLYCYLASSKNEETEPDFGLGPGVGVELGLELVPRSSSQRVVGLGPRSGSERIGFGMGPRSGSERIGFGLGPRSVSEKSGLQSGAVLRKWCEAQAAKEGGTPKRESVLFKELLKQKSASIPEKDVAIDVELPDEVEDFSAKGTGVPPKTGIGR